MTMKPLPAAILLLEACLLTTLALDPASKPSPRGFKAAYELEKATLQQLQQQAASLPLQLPPKQQQQQQQQQQHVAEEAAAPLQQAAQRQGACPASLLPPLPVQPQPQCRTPPVWWALAAVAAVFACGVAVGAAMCRRAWHMQLLHAAHPAAAAAVAGPAAPPPAGPIKGEGLRAQERPSIASPESEGGDSRGGSRAAQQGTAMGEAASLVGAVGEAAPAASAAELALPKQADAEQQQQQQPPQPEQLVAEQQQQQEQQGAEAELGTATLVLEQATATISSGTTAPAATVGDASSIVAGRSLVAGSSAVAEADRADILAAGALVAELTRSLQIDVAVLSASERLQLVHTVLQAWQAQQAKRHGEAMARLGSEANVLRGSRRDIAAQQAALERAREAHALTQERVAQFRRACSDTLTFGLAVMLAVAAYQVAHGGGAAAAAAALFARCGRFALPQRSGWGLLWGGWGGLAAGWCYAATAWEAAQGFAVLLAAPWLVYRTGLLTDHQALPLTRLLAGLGLACGAVGYVAVGKVGGSAAAWLAVWEVWVVVQVAAAAAAHRIFRVAVRTAEGEGGVAAAAAMYEHSFGWLHGLMWVLVGVLLPLLAGWLPFRV